VFPNDLEAGGQALCPPNGPRVPRCLREQSPLVKGAGGSDRCPCFGLHSRIHLLVGYCWNSRANKLCQVRRILFTTQHLLTASTSSSTALEAGLEPYRKGFAFVVPPVTDSGWLAEHHSDSAEYSRLLALGMDCRGEEYRRLPWTLTEYNDYFSDLFTHLGKAFTKLSEGPLREYIPGPDWKFASDLVKLQPMFQHLLPDQEVSHAQIAIPDASEEIAKLVVAALEIPAEELSPRVPLTSYGLDSLSAAQLAVSLRPFMRVTQVQLLADMSMEDLLSVAGQSSFGTGYEEG
jgi:hypothetical protein